MQQAIETRELFVLEGHDVLIRGTFHRPPDEGSGMQSDTIAQDRIGVLFLNSASPTRAQNGDAAVYLADSFAARGYPTFRLDLPGFGDSAGDPPADLLDYVNRGRYASIASAKVEELVARFHLSGVVIAGHCAGTVSALFAAGVSYECKGLVLIGPYFYLPQSKKPTKFQQRLNLWALKSGLGRFSHKSYEVLKQIRLFLRGSGLPATANFPLLRCWKTLASTGLPVLILKGPDRKSSGMKPHAAEFDYLAHALRIAGRKSRIVVKVTEGANNAFANSVGRNAVQLHTEQWLNTCFPRKVHKDSQVNELHRKPGSSETEYEDREQFLKV
jgi:pimeloyl-ACP methyl ester carboxylesterase